MFYVNDVAENTFNFVYLILWGTVYIVFRESATGMSYTLINMFFFHYESCPFHLLIETIFIIASFVFLKLSVAAFVT